MLGPFELFDPESTPSGSVASAQRLRRQLNPLAFIQVLCISSGGNQNEFSINTIRGRAKEKSAISAPE